MQIFDSHAHYYDARFSSEECPGGAEALLDTLFSSGLLAGVINVGVDVPSTRRAIAQARHYPRMYVAAGIHPTDAMQYTDMAGELDALRALCTDNDNKVVALGEIGLDHHYPDTDYARQRQWLEAQLELAEELSLPVVIHDREAHGECFDAICAHPGVRGVFHSYSGSLEMAQDLVRRGWYISFSGTVTFKNAHRVAQVAASVPHEAVLIETDCPYLAPHPFRGSLNHSGRLPLVVEQLAALWGETAEAVARQTRENALRFFAIPSLP